MRLGSSVHTRQEQSYQKLFYFLWELCVLITQPRSRALDVF